MTRAARHIFCVPPRSWSSALPFHRTSPKALSRLMKLPEPGCAFEYFDYPGARCGFRDIPVRRGRPLCVVPKHNHPVRGGNGFWPMCDDDACDLELLDSVINQFFPLDIQVAGRLVKEKNLWSFVERPCQEEPLFLPP